eukprot:jgi/Ulvmu1/9949/UM058_0032.1
MIQYLVFVVALGLLSPLRLSDARDSFVAPSVPCCDKKDRVCCDGSCFEPGTVFVKACESNSCGCPDEDEQAKCCSQKDRVCCDGRCFPPGTFFFAPCESTSCGCPDEMLEEDCCPPDHYCCYSQCDHISIVHVWCGPPDAPTCCEVLEGGGGVPTLPEGLASDI